MGHSSSTKTVKFALLVCLVLMAAIFGGGRQGEGFTGKSVGGGLLVVFFAIVALRFMGHPFLKNFAFTVWVFAFVSASLFFPKLFLQYGNFKLSLLIVPLIQIITFGMGTSLSVPDFTRIFKMPWPVLVALLAHFLIMPLTGFTLAKVFAFEGAVAAGIVLIGSCPSGVASNVMTYLAGGNVALAVTITACSTLAAPFLTPLLMKWLAGEFIEVQFAKMMLEIINMIIVPIVAGLIANRILYSHAKAFGRGTVLAAIGAGCVVSAVLVVRSAPRELVHFWGTSVYAEKKVVESHWHFRVGPPPKVLPQETLTRNVATDRVQTWVAPFRKDGLVVGLLLVGLVTLSKLVVRVWLHGPEKWMDKALPTVSMLAICCIIAVITAAGAKDLIAVGPLLIVVTIIHNGVGYLLGYWISRLVRLEESWCRTVAFEVGMQNGGMASGLAMDVLKSTKAALAPAIFGPWQNVSGSILASLWRRRPPAASANEKPCEVAMNAAR